MSWLTHELLEKLKYHPRTQEEAYGMDTGPDTWIKYGHNSTHFLQLGTAEAYPASGGSLYYLENGDDVGHIYFSLPGLIELGEAEGVKLLNLMTGANLDEARHALGVLGIKESEWKDYNGRIALMKVMKAFAVQRKDVKRTMDESADPIDGGHVILDQFPLKLNFRLGPNTGCLMGLNVGDGKDGCWRVSFYDTPSNEDALWNSVLAEIRGNAYELRSAVKELGYERTEDQLISDIFDAVKQRFTPAPHPNRKGELMLAPVKRQSVRRVQDESLVSQLRDAALRTATHLTEPRF